MSIEKISNYMGEMHNLLDRLPIELIDEMIDILNEARMHGRQVFIMGNGGSASTASHFAADLAKNTRSEGLPHFKVIGLADNMAVFSALANDEGYENVFVQQLASFVRPFDVVIGISASGNSMNVIKAIELANQVRARTIGMTGFDGGKLGPMVDLHVHVPSNIIEMVEDVHLMIEHVIVRTIKELNQEQSIPAEYTGIFSNIAISQDGHNFEMNGNEGSRENGKGNKSTPERIRASLEVLNDMNMNHSQRSEQSETLSKVLSVTMNSVSAESGSLLMLDENGSVLDAALSYDGNTAVYNADQMAEIAEKGLAGWVVTNRQPVLVPRTSEDPRWLPREWEKSQNHSRSAVSVPLMDKDRVMGVLTLVRSDTERFTRDDLVLLTAIAVFVSAKSSQGLILTHD